LTLTKPCRDAKPTVEAKNVKMEGLELKG
jgi:hypothetical protein